MWAQNSPVAGYVIKLRKSVDDLGLFLFAFVLCVVARALWLA